MVSAKNPEARRLTSHILKTAAATMQLKAGAEPFQQVLHPRMAAYAQQ
jgi:hypothetical protein